MTSTPESVEAESAEPEWVEPDLAVAEIVANPELLAAGETALAVLFEMAPMEHVGALIDTVVHEENLVTLLYESLLPGYPGWRWAVTITKADEDQPVTVSETHLQPGEGSLVAPEWVPWSKRLAEFREAKALQISAEAEAANEAADQLRYEDESDEDDLLDNDFSDFDDELDGVDVDLLDGVDEEADVTDEEDDSEDDDDSNDSNDSNDSDEEE